MRELSSPVLESSASELDRYASDPAAALFCLGTEDGRAFVTENGQPFILEIATTAINSSVKG